MEYLKTCVFKFMVASDPKDKLRLGNVISTILKLTSQERAEVDNMLAWESNKIVGLDDGITSIASFASSSLESIFVLHSEQQAPGTHLTWRTLCRINNV
jgi:hypothetical protein